jgi:hypothetical protein
MIEGVRAAGQYGKEGDVHAAEKLTMERMAIHQKEFMSGHGYWEIIKDLCLLLRLSRVSECARLRETALNRAQDSIDAQDHQHERDQAERIWRHLP